MNTQSLHFYSILRENVIEGKLQWKDVFLTFANLQTQVTLCIDFLGSCQGFERSSYKWGSLQYEIHEFIVNPSLPSVFCLN